MTPMFYTIRHVTRFTYESSITESVMEARMQPLSEGPQRCIRFGLSTTPAARVRMYADPEGNIVHHFNIPGRHTRLTVTAEALVECAESAALPERLDAGAWQVVDRQNSSGEFWELLHDSPFARQTPLLAAFAQDAGLERGDDPLATLRRMMSAIYAQFEYSPHATRVDSPIDEALEARRGVCQDFAHIMIALSRGLGVPCRYVSGYLFQQSDREMRSTDGATHAWVEALLPGLGWVGFDPTNDMVAGDRHIRVAIGRDYADVPPTRGVFKGLSAVKSELAVGVAIGTAQPALSGDVPAFVPWMSQEAMGAWTHDEGGQQQ
jgi:transglutaminase-like putative cysteine protease